MSSNTNPYNPYASQPDQSLPNQGFPHQGYPNQGYPNQGYSNPGYGGYSPGVPMGYREVDKVLYVVLLFFLGHIGIHRFLRGQIGLGILMLLCNWMTLGIWWLVDFIISLVKLGQYPGDKFFFDENGKWAYVR